MSSSPGGALGDPPTENPLNGAPRKRTLNVGCGCLPVLVVVLWALVGVWAYLNFIHPSGAVESTGDGASRSPTDNCMPLSTELMHAIMDGARRGTGMKALGGSVVRSDDFPNIFIVAMTFSATGVSTHVAVFATDSLHPDGIVMSVSEFAEHLTIWPDSNDMKPEVTIISDGVDEAMTCAGAFVR